MSTSPTLGNDRWPPILQVLTSARIQTILCQGSPACYFARDMLRLILPLLSFTHLSWPCLAWNACLTIVSAYWYLFFVLCFFYPCLHSSHFLSSRFIYTLFQFLCHVCVVFSSTSHLAARCNSAKIGNSNHLTLSYNVAKLMMKGYKSRLYKSQTLGLRQIQLQDCKMCQTT